jgi:hypothetical protein
LNLERSIGNFEKKLNRVDPVLGARNKTRLSRWKGRQIIPLDDWIELRDTPYAFRYFPDDFDQTLTCISEDELVTQQEQEHEYLRKWNSDYQELMKYTKNPNYGRLKCFHCLLSPDDDDPILIGINRLVAKGLTGGEATEPIQYPCQVVNRFHCPFVRTNAEGDDVEVANSKVNVDDLFRLHKMAFLVEIALAKARKEDSNIQIRDKQELLHALTDRDTFMKILQQADDPHNSLKYRGITVEKVNNLP